jgi:AcrR family transcriptional regulator
MQPALLSNLSGGRQQRKSAEMRILILEMTIDCLVSDGYSGLSLQKVVQAADISRGAMHHHFPTKMDLVAAAIEYTFYRRMQQFLADFSGDKADPVEVVRAAAEKHWLNVQTREYAAYLELAIAARTNEELNNHFQPAAEYFDRVWVAEMVKSFPQWRERWVQLQLANDFAVAVHMGMLLNKPILHDGKRLDNVRNLAMDVILKLHASVVEDD